MLENEMILPERLKLLRKQKRLTQDQLAEVLRIGIQSIKRYETGKQDASSTHLILIADFFGVSTDYLLGRSNRANMEDATNGK
jgi:transcriptional regulator with XRE-family HTH domain